MTKERLVEGIARYIQMELIPSAPETSTKMMLSTFAIALTKNPRLTDAILDNPIVSALITSEDGYSIDALADGLRESIQQYGNLKITIPKVPLIMPNEQVMSFGADDVETLMMYLIN